MELEDGQEGGEEVLPPGRAFFTRTTRTTRAKPMFSGVLCVLVTRTAPVPPVPGPYRRIGLASCRAAILSQPVYLERVLKIFRSVSRRGGAAGFVARRSQISIEYAPSYEPVEKLQQFILWRGGRADVVAPPLQIPADMLGRRASSSHPPRSQSEMPQYFNRLLAPRHPPRRARNPFPSLFLKHALNQQCWSRPPGSGYPFGQFDAIAIALHRSRNPKRGCRWDLPPCGR